ncbi:hypothetical protein STENM327S_05205 [Streptomyces tendae]
MGGRAGARLTVRGGFRPGRGPPCTRSHAKMMFRQALTRVLTTRVPWVARELRTESGRMTSLSSGESAAHPDRIDTSRPHPARMYDYFLGGKDNYQVDQRAAEQFMKSAPEVREGVLANRHFMHRAVRHVVAEGGIRQILDVGTGLPTEPERAPDRTVRRPRDPGRVRRQRPHCRHPFRALSDDPDTTVVLADLRDPRAILDHPQVRAVIDFDRPVALLLVAVVHFVADAEDPAGIVATLRDALRPAPT